MIEDRRRIGVEKKFHSMIPHLTVFKLEINVNKNSIRLQNWLHFDCHVDPVKDQKLTWHGLTEIETWNLTF